LVIVFVFLLQDQGICMPRRVDTLTTWTGTGFANTGWGEDILYGWMDNRQTKLEKIIRLRDRKINYNYWSLHLRLNPISDQSTQETFIDVYQSSIKVFGLPCHTTVLPDFRVRQ